MLYVPILKAKLAEFRALGSLDTAVRAAIQPLIEVYEPYHSGEEKDPVKHLHLVAQRLAKSWRQDRPIWVDVRRFLSKFPALPIHPLLYLRDSLMESGTTLVPVVSPSDSPDYISVAAECTSHDGTGVCFRLGTACLSPQGMVGLEPLMKRLGVAPEQADMVIDFGYTTPEQVPVNVVAAAAAIEKAEHLHKWRSLTVASGGFPETLARLAEVSRLPRTDWAVWKQLADAGLQRRASYGDYGVDNPRFSEPSKEGQPNPSVALRYTADDHWLVVRRGQIFPKANQRGGHKEFHNVCRRVVKEPEYCGPDFCWGDKFIKECAERKEKPGSPMTWRAVAVSHHITFVVRQVASQVGS